MTDDAGAGYGPGSWARSGAWDGTGLPPVAQARLAREGLVRSSLLSVGGAFGAEVVGLQPIGDVMGVIVEHVGWQGLGCPSYGFGGTYRGAGTVVSGAGGSWAGLGGYAQALYRGYDTALDRLVQEATALSAHGVVGVTFDVRGLGQGNREFIALGTAVRADVGARPATPFTTLLGGADSAKLLLAGWMPVAAMVGLAIGIRHDDWATQRQAMAWRANAEVSGYTDLVASTRAAARNELDARGRAAGADGIVVDLLTTVVHSVEPSDNHIDHVAESYLIGSSIAHVGGPHAVSARALAILPVS